MFHSARNMTLQARAVPVEEARNNLQEALELFFETASPQEISVTFHGEIYITRMDVAFG